MWGQQRLEQQQQQQQQHRLEQQAAGNIRIWHTMWHILNFYYTRTLALMQWHFYYRPKRRRGLFTAPTVGKRQSQPSTPTSPWHPRLPESHTQYPHLVAGTPKKCPVHRMVSIFIMCSDPEPRHAPPTLSPISSFAIPPPFCAPTLSSLLSLADHKTIHLGHVDTPVRFATERERQGNEAYLIMIFKLILIAIVGIIQLHLKCEFLTLQINVTILKILKIEVSYRIKR